MARRVAINIGQRTALSNQGRGRGNNARGRGKTAGRGRDKIEGRNLSTTKDTNVRDTTIKTSPCIKNSDSKKEGSFSVNDEAELLPKIETITDGTALDDAKHEPKSEEKSAFTDVESELSKRGRKRMQSELDCEVVDVEVMRVMGFSNFNTTKNKKVKGTDCYGINFKQKTEYRQYMNREGGFNRELSPTRGDKKKIKMSLKKGNGTSK